MKAPGKSGMPCLAASRLKVSVRTAMRLAWLALRRKPGGGIASEIGRWGAGATGVMFGVCAAAEDGSAAPRAISRTARTAARSRIAAHLGRPRGRRLLVVGDRGE